MKDLVTRMQAQLKALAQKYPAAAEELGMNFELNAGASEADFVKLEQTLGYALPEEFKEFYRVANGEPDIDGVFAGDEWLSIDRIIDEYAVWKDLYDDGGNGKMIDLDPAPSGTAGQIIQMWHDDAAREKEANSLREFLQNYVQDLEAGRYVLDADYGVILQAELDDLNAE